jgi:hypothetical protein
MLYITTPVVMGAGELDAVLEEAFFWAEACLRAEGFAVAEAVVTATAVIAAQATSVDANSLIELERPIEINLRVRENRFRVDSKSIRLDLQNIDVGKPPLCPDHRPASATSVRQRRHFILLAPLHGSARSG